MGNLNSESCTLAETHVSLVMEAMFEGWEELDSECFPGANTVGQSEWAAAYKCEEDAHIYVYMYAIRLKTTQENMFSHQKCHY